MWTIGVDPGLVETGMVLLGPEGQYLGGVTYRASRSGDDLERINSLADTICSQIRYWVYKNNIDKLLIGIEYPYLRSSSGGAYNAETYRKQVNLLHAIETGLYVYFDKSPIRIAEVNPVSVKKTITGHGSATKEDMIKASPLKDRDDIRNSSREALADAWGHAITAKKVAGEERLIDLEEIAYERLKPYFVDTRVYKLEVENAQEEE